MDTDGITKVIFPAQLATIGFTFPSPASEPCALNQYRNYSGAACALCPHACEPCPAGTSGFDVCECLPNHFKRRSWQLNSPCEQCPEGADCSGGGALPKPRSGYWVDLEGAAASASASPVASPLGTSDVEEVLYPNMSLAAEVVPLPREQPIVVVVVVVVMVMVIVGLIRIIPVVIIAVVVTAVATLVWYECNGV